jgi:hypothetical protein
MIGAEILAISFKTLDPPQQLQLVKIIKKVFDKDTPFSNNKSKITWEVKHSFLYFLANLI